MSKVVFLINIVAISSLYAMVAIGLTVIFGIGNVLNFAHGAVATVGAFVAYQFAAIWGINLWLSAAIAVLIAGLSGVVIYITLVRYVESIEMILILTLLAGLILQHALRLIGPFGRFTVPAFFDGTTPILEGTISNNLLWIFFVSLIINICIFLFITYTKLGKAIRAINMNRKGSMLVGINANKINILIWALASMLAGLAGIFWSSFQVGSWFIGIELLVISLTIVIVGGLGSVTGTLIAAFIIGFAETTTVTFINPNLTGLPSLVLLLAIIILRPEGLFGEKTEAYQRLMRR